MLYIFKESIRSMFFLASIFLFNFFLFKYLEEVKPGLGPLGIIVCVALTGRVIAGSFMKFLSDFLFLARGGSCSKMYGRQYEFDGCKITFYLSKSVIWMPAADLDNIFTTSLKTFKKFDFDYEIYIPGTKTLGFNEEMISRLLLNHIHRDENTHGIIRFQKWLKNEALPNVKRFPSSAINK